MQVIRTMKCGKSYIKRKVQQVIRKIASRQLYLVTKAINKQANNK